MQIDYTSRDFASLKADLIELIRARTNQDWNPTDSSDLGNILVESFAYMGDIMSHYIDKVANETSIETAIKRSTLLAFANLYNYKPSGPTPASISITFTNVSTSSVDIPVGTQVMAVLNYGAFSEVYFETTASATALAAGASITLPALEGKTVNTDRPDLIDSTYNRALPANLGTSNGTANQNFSITDTGVIDNSLIVYVGQGSAFGSWSYVDNLLESGPEDRVFTTFRDEYGFVNVTFGDNVTGSVPAANQTISAVYRSSAGSAGNIKSLSVSEVTFIPGNIDPQSTSYLSVSNSLPSYGGAEADDMSQLRSKIKAAISTRRRAVTLKDYEDLATQVSQVGKANAAASVYSAVNLYLQTQDDGSAAPGYPQFVISNAVGSGSAVTYTTKTINSLVVGDTVNITGIYPVAYNLQGATVASVASDLKSFTVTSTVTGTFDVTNSRTGLVIKLSSTLGGVATTPAWNNIKTAVTAYMTDKIPAGVTLNILSPTYVPVYITSSVTIAPSYKQSDVKLAIYQAMLGTNGLFSYKNNLFGDAVYLSTIISTIQAVPGVLSVNVTQLSTDGSTTVASSLSLTDSQIPYLTPTNLVSNLSGGII
jgi:hypothetical protein